MNIEEETKMKLEQVWHQSFTSKEILDMENGYKSIAEIICKDLEARFEDDVFKVVQKYDINVNKEELIKALKYDREQYDAGYKDGYKCAFKEIMYIIDEYVGAMPQQMDTIRERQITSLKGLNDYINYKLNKLIEQEGKK